MVLNPSSTPPNAEDPEQKTPTLEVLVHTTDEMQQSINSHLTAANVLCGVLPLAVAALLVIPAEMPFATPALGVGFVVAVCLISILKLGLWMEISRSIAYRSTVLYPQLFRLAGLECGTTSGYLARLARERQLYRWVLLHGGVALVCLAIGAWVALRGHAAGFGLRALVVGGASLATLSAYAVALPQVRKNLAVAVEAGPRADGVAQET